MMVMTLFFVVQDNGNLLMVYITTIHVLTMMKKFSLLQLRIKYIYTPERNQNGTRRPGGYRISLATHRTKIIRKILSSNFLPIFPPINQDINRALDIYGPSLASLKGKTTCTRPSAIKSLMVPVDQEIITQHEYLTVYRNIMTINGHVYHYCVKSHWILSLRSNHQEEHEYNEEMCQVDNHPV